MIQPTTACKCDSEAEVQRLTSNKWFIWLNVQVCWSAFALDHFGLGVQWTALPGAVACWFPWADRIVSSVWRTKTVSCKWLISVGSWFLLYGQHMMLPHNLSLRWKRVPWSTCISQWVLFFFYSTWYSTALQWFIIILSIMNFLFENEFLYWNWDHWSTAEWMLLAIGVTEYAFMFLMMKYLQ